MPWSSLVNLLKNIPVSGIIIEPFDHVFLIKQIKKNVVTRIYFVLVVGQTTQWPLH